jgi:manganese-dependent inorganic pyrophosphatase
MITHPLASFTRLLPAVILLLSGCQLESFSERQARQRQQYMGEAASSQEPLLWTSRRSPTADGAISSLMAAHLYGGQASISGELTPPTQAILQRCQQSAPQPTRALTGSAIGLVGVNQGSDLDPRVQASQVVAIIDHHASGSGALALEQPRRIDLRPWGATATILEQQAQRLGVVLPKPLACAALGAIVSQTKGLQSARTTAQDRQSAARLARRAGIQQAQLLTTFDLEER